MGMFSERMFLKKNPNEQQNTSIYILVSKTEKDKDGKYQQVYTNHFGRLKPKRDDLFTKELNSDYGGFNSAYPADLRLSGYSEKVIAPSESLAPAVSSEDDWL